MINIKFKNIIRISLIIIVLMVFFMPLNTFSQFRERPPMVYREFRENVSLDPLVFYYKDSLDGRLDLYIEIPIRTLQFKYNYSKANYSSSFDYIITVKNLTDNIIADNTYNETLVNSESEQKSMSSASLYRIKQFYLSPDKYKIIFKLKDNNSLNEYNKTLDFEIRYIDKNKLIFSDIMLLSDFKIDSNGKKEITPIINGYLGKLKEFYIFYEVVNKTDSTFNYTYNYNVINKEGKSFGKGTLDCTINPGINQFFEKLNVNNNITGNYKIEISDINTNEVVTEKTLNNFSNEMPYPRRGPRGHI